MHKKRVIFATKKLKINGFDTIELDLVFKPHRPTVWRLLHLACVSVRLSGTILSPVIGRFG